MTTQAEEIKKVLEEQNIQFEESSDAIDSPLNQPVSEGDTGESKQGVTILKTEAGDTEQESPRDEKEQDAATSPGDDVPLSGEDTGEEEQPDDGVPEQEISDSYNENLDNEIAGDAFELPTGHARQAANTVLGITDNLLAVGGGLFVKIKKHKDFYDFEEIVQVIDEQNEKNVRRIKLDEEDKILLRPLLIAIIKKRAKKLTPEQQLLGAAMSILMKKIRLAVEIKHENNILLEKILDIIREEKGEDTVDIPEEGEAQEDTEHAEKQQEDAPEQLVTSEQDKKESVVEKHQSPVPVSVIEVAEDDK